MNPLNTRPVSAKVLDAAIAWQLCLDGDNDSATEREAFNQWLSANEEHSRAWRQLGLLDQRFTIGSGPARRALQHSDDSARRKVRRLRSGLAGMLLVGCIGLLLGTTRYLPMDYWLADQRTATGEQRSVRLADDTLVRLNTHSAIDVRFDGKERRIILQDGEILVETGSHNDPRPFIVETRDGRMQALGTRFLVKREDDDTLLSVLQSAVAAHPQGGEQEQIIREGQQIRLSSSGLSPMLTLKPGADAWTRGMLVVDNARLADLIDELGRYRQGHLGVASDVADLRITGSFPLHDTDLALKALAPTLPVQIEQHTPWWVTVIAQDKKAPTAGKM
jgi:transmembrane sensor